MSPLTHISDKEPRPPRDPATVARMLAPRLADALRSAHAGAGVAFPVKAPLRFLGLIDFHCELTDLGRDVAGRL